MSAAFNSALSDAPGTQLVTAASSSSSSAVSTASLSDDTLLRDHLNPFDFTDELAFHRSQFLPGTHKLQFELFERWMNVHSLGGYLIKADSGTGKTCFLSELTKRYDADVVAIHFCRAEMYSRADPARMIQSIAYQMAQRLPAFKQQLLKILRMDAVAASLSMLTPTDLWFQLINSPFSVVRQEVMSARADRRLLIVIDSISDAPRNLIVPLMSAVGGSMPNGLSLVLSTTPPSALRIPFSECLSPFKMNSSGLQLLWKKELPAVLTPNEEIHTAVAAAMRLDCNFFVARVLLQFSRVDSDGAPSLTIDQIKQWNTDKTPMVAALTRHFCSSLERMDPDNVEKSRESLQCLFSIVQRTCEPMSLAALTQLINAFAFDPSIAKRYLLPVGNPFTVERVAQLLRVLHPMVWIWNSHSASAVSAVDPCALVSINHCWKKFMPLIEFANVVSESELRKDFFDICWKFLSGGWHRTEDEDPYVQPEESSNLPLPPLSSAVIAQFEQFHQRGRIDSANSADDPLYPSPLLRYAIAHIVHDCTSSDQRLTAVCLLIHPQMMYLRCLLSPFAAQQILSELQREDNFAMSIDDREREEGSYSWIERGSSAAAAVRLYCQLLDAQRQMRWKRQPNLVLEVQPHSLRKLTNAFAVIEQRKSSNDSVMHFQLTMASNALPMIPEASTKVLATAVTTHRIETLLIMGCDERCRDALLPVVVSLLQQADCPLRTLEVRSSALTDAVTADLFAALTATQTTASAPLISHPLQRLLLPENRLRNLPQSFQMRGWQGLREIDLSGNRTLLSPVYALVFISEKALQYFKDLASEVPQRVSKLRLMVTGFGGVGKTTFIQALTKAMPERMALAKARDNAALADAFAGVPSTSPVISATSASASAASPASPLRGFLSGLGRCSPAEIAAWHVVRVEEWARVRELPLLLIQQIRKQHIDGRTLTLWDGESNSAQRRAFVETCIRAEGSEQSNSASASASPPAEPLSPYKDHSGQLLSWGSVRSSRVADLDRELSSEISLLLHTTGYYSTSAPVQSSLGDFELLDFSGQLEYYVSHSLFLSGQHAIFICVAPAAKQFGSKGMEVEDENKSAVASSSASASSSSSSSSSIVEPLQTVTEADLSTPDALRRRDQWQFWLRFLSTLSPEGARTPVHLAVSRCDFMPRRVVEQKLKPLVKAQREALSAVHSAEANPRLQVHSTVHTLDYRDAVVDADMNSVCDEILDTAKRMFQESLIPFVYHKLEVKLRAEIIKRKGSKSESADGCDSSASGAWTTGLPIMSEEELSTFAIAVDSRYQSDPDLLKRCCDHLRGVALLLHIPSLKIYVLEPIRWLAAVLALFIRDSREDDQQLQKDRMEFDRLMKEAEARSADEPVVAAVSLSSAAGGPSLSTLEFLTPYHLVKHQLESSGLARGDEQCRQAAAILVSLGLAHHQAEADQFLFPTQLPPVDKNIAMQKMFQRLHLERKLQRPVCISEQRWAEMLPAGASLLDHRRLHMHYAAANQLRRLQPSVWTREAFPTLPDSFFEKLAPHGSANSENRLSSFSGTRLRYDDVGSFLPPGLFVQLQMALIKTQFATARYELCVQSYEMRRGMIAIHLAQSGDADDSAESPVVASLLVQLELRSQCVDVFVFTQPMIPAHEIGRSVGALLGNLGSSGFAGFQPKSVKLLMLCPFCVAACRLQCCQFEPRGYAPDPTSSNPSVLAKQLNFPHESTATRAKEIAAMEIYEFGKMSKVLQRQETNLPRYRCLVDENAPTMLEVEMQNGAVWRIQPPRPVAAPTSAVDRPAFGRYTSCLPIDAIPIRATKPADAVIVPGSVSCSSVVPAEPRSDSSGPPVDVFIVWSFDARDDLRKYLLPLIYCLGELKLTVHHELRGGPLESPLHARELSVAMRAPFVIMLFTAALLDSARMETKAHSINALRIVKYRAEQAHLQRERIAAGKQIAEDARFDFQPCALLPIFIPTHDGETVSSFLRDADLEFDAEQSPFLRAIEADAEECIVDPPIPTDRYAEWLDALVGLQKTIKSLMPPSIPAAMSAPSAAVITVSRTAAKQTWFIDPALLTPQQLAQYKSIRTTKESQFKTAARVGLLVGENEVMAKELEAKIQMQQKRIENVEQSSMKLESKIEESVQAIKRKHAESMDSLLRTILQMQQFGYPTAIVLPAPAIKEEVKGFFATLSSLADSVSLESMMCTEVQVRLMCECSADPAEWHYADEKNPHGGYKVKQPNQFIQAHGKTLKLGLQILSAAAKLVPFVGGVVSDAFSGSVDSIRAISNDALKIKIGSGLDTLIGFVDTTVADAKGDSANALLSSSAGTDAQRRSAASTATDESLAEFLDKMDREEKRKVKRCGLKEVVLQRNERYAPVADSKELRERKSGSVIWLCELHAAEYTKQQWGRIVEEEKKNNAVEVKEKPETPASAAPLTNNFVGSTDSATSPAAATASPTSSSSAPAAASPSHTSVNSTAPPNKQGGCCTVQ